ncbi:MAG: hypothetical protein ACRDMK_07120 [Gaiellaceae bacterium]
MAFLDRIRSWWSKDALEQEEQEELAGMSQADRDAAEEDFEGRKDDVAARSRLLGGAADYERDSEPPRP